MPRKICKSLIISCLAPGVALSTEDSRLNTDSMLGFN